MAASSCASGMRSSAPRAGRREQRRGGSRVGEQRLRHRIVQQRCQRGLRRARRPASRRGRCGCRARRAGPAAARRAAVRWPCSTTAKSCPVRGTTKSGRSAPPARGRLRGVGLQDAAQRRLPSASIARRIRAGGGLDPVGEPGAERCAASGWTACRRASSRARRNCDRAGRPSRTIMSGGTVGNGPSL